MSDTEKKFSRFFLLFLAISVIGLIIYTVIHTMGLFAKFATMGPPDFGPAQVVVSEVVMMDFVDTIEAIGTAEADESTTITATETEIIESIHFEEGQLVQAGDLLLQLKDNEEVATYEEARKSYDRYTSLAKANAGSRARRDEARALMQVAYARVQDRKIKAPFDGILGIREVSVGDLMRPGTIITTIDDLDPMEIEFSVPERYVGILEKGLEIDARTSAFPTKQFPGAIETINPRIDPQTRAVRVKARVENPENLLRPGLLLTVNILHNNRKSLAIPEEAIQSQGRQSSVMRVVEKMPEQTDNDDSQEEDKQGPQTIPEAVPVTIGARKAGYIEIIDGLNEDDLIIVEGIKAKPGEAVTITETRTIGQQIDLAIDQAAPTKQDEMQDLQSRGSMPKSQEEDVLEQAPDVTYGTTQERSINPEDTIVPAPEEGRE